MYSRLAKFSFVVIIVLVGGLFCGNALFAQEIKGPIKIIVPYPAGGGSDVVARLIADKIKDSLGQPTIVENKTGAGGRIGTEYAKTQPADGTALLMVNPALFIVNPLVFKNLAYDPTKDFELVSLVTTYQFCLSIPAGAPQKTVAELMEWIRKNPNQANYGSPAAGSLPHFFGLMISKAAGVDMVHSSYNGSGPLVTALIGNQIPMGVDAIDAQSQYHPDKIRILATSGTSRKHPDIPTFIEQGFPEIQGVGWNALVVPAKTPPAIVKRLSEAVVAALKMPDVAEKVKATGNDVMGTTPEEFAAIYKKDVERWTPVIKASGFKAD